MQKILSISVLAILIACSAFINPGKFEAQGITFSYPSDWKITGSEDLSGAGYYVSCEKEGSNSSGLVTVTWVNQVSDLTKITNQYKDALEKQFDKQGATSNFSYMKDGTYAGKKCRMVTYTAKVMTVPHQGTVRSFIMCGKTVTVVSQEALEDVSVNKVGFAKIESTLGCAK